MLAGEWKTFLGDIDMNTSLEVLKQRLQAAYDNKTVGSKR